MIKRFILAVALISLCLAGISTTGRAVEVGPEIKSYTKVGGVSGNLNSIGSYTVNNLITFLASGFNRLYPSAKVCQRSTRPDPLDCSVRLDEQGNEDDEVDILYDQV